MVARYPQQSQDGPGRALTSRAGRPIIIVRQTIITAGKKGEHAPTPEIQDHHLLPAPEMFQQVQRVKEEEGRDMSEMVREALRLYMEERELRREQRLDRLRSRQSEREDDRRSRRTHR